MAIFVIKKIKPRKFSLNSRINKIMKLKKRKLSILTKTISLVLLYSICLYECCFGSDFLPNQIVRNSVFSQTFGKYTTDLTALAAQGKIRPTANLDNEVNRLIQILASERSRQPVVLDDKRRSRTRSLNFLHCESLPEMFRQT